MGTHVATLGPAKLDQSGLVSWRLQDGVEPVMQAFTLDKMEAKKLRDGDRVSLVVQADGRTLRVHDLVVTGRGSTPDPFTDTVVVADQRIWWRRHWIRGSFNIRRRTADVRRLDEDGVLPAELAPVVNDITYAVWSLKDEAVVYRPQEIVAGILDVLAPGMWDGNLGQFQASPVDTFEIDDAGPEALRKALDLLVGADVFVDHTGRVQIKNALDASATSVALNLADPMTGSPLPRFVDLSAMRPSYIECLLDVEQEVRFDFSEGTSYTDVDGRWMQNVIPVPDKSIVVNGKTVVLGTYVEMQSYLTAIGLSEVTVRKYWLTPFLENIVCGLGQLNPTANTVARVRAIRQHYRQTYRINKRWMARIYSMRDYRCSVWDPESGFFGPSLAYMDYCLVPGTKGIASTNLFHQHPMLNMTGHGVAASAALTTSSASPFRVSIVDEHLGIIRVDGVTDLNGNIAKVIPGTVDNVASLDMRGNLYPLFLDGTRVGPGGVGISLSSSFLFSTVLTLAPASPNSTKRLHSEIVTRGDADAYIPKTVFTVGVGRGRPWQIRIGAGLVTARFAWVHGRRGDIERSFGVGIKPEQSDRSKVADLLVNKSEVQNMAKAMAGSLYASMADRWEGAKTMTFTPQILPYGTIRAVEHRIDSEGAPVTIVACPPPTRSIDPMSVLPVSVRRQLGAVIQP